MLWRSSEYSVRESVRNAMRVAVDQGFLTVAFPLIGAGSGGGSADAIQAFMTDELSRVPFAGEVSLVRYRRST
jgi:O-acetyl-ADP-ribose deacetylase (regulator of RNase III)